MLTASVAGNPALAAPPVASVAALPRSTRAPAQHPTLHEGAVRSVAALVSLARAKLEDRTLPHGSVVELEVKWGTLPPARADVREGGARFVAGVPLECLGILADDFQRYAGWSQVHASREVVQTFHEDKMKRPMRVSTYPNDRARSRAWASEGKQQGGAGAASTPVAVDPAPLVVDRIYKERLGDVALRCDRRAADMQGLDISVAASVETPVPDHLVPCVVGPPDMYVRRKQTAGYERTGASGTWRYDLSVVTEGRAHADAFQNRRIHGEVEVEVVDLAALLRFYSGADDRPERASSRTEAEVDILVAREVLLKAHGVQRTFAPDVRADAMYVPHQHQ